MKAQILRGPADVEQRPLHLTDFPRPVPEQGRILVQVSVCGVCHTDLHVIEGELPDTVWPCIPGHEIVGRVIENGPGASRYPIGARVGIPWLHQACGTCDYCKRGQENLCPWAKFTGYTAPGGYAEYVTVPEQFAVTLPDVLTDVQAAPLLCAGIVGYRSLRISGLEPGERLGLYGYGSSADLVIQIARHWNCEVFVFTRSPEHQELAKKRGAAWVGTTDNHPPKQIDRAILFAPVGALVPRALTHIRKAGTVCINAIHTSPIPEMPYHLLWGERTIRTVANATRRDAEEFMALAPKIPIETNPQCFDLPDANLALRKLKHSEINGTAVLKVKA